jgi:hypothetical protein
MNFVVTAQIKQYKFTNSEEEKKSHYALQHGIIKVSLTFNPTTIEGII